MRSTKALKLRLLLPSLLAISLVLANGFAMGAILCDGDVASSGDGTCWSGPFKTILEAMAGSSFKEAF